MTEDAKPKILKAFCSSCGGERNCDVMGEYDKSFDDEVVWGRTTWRILACRGCENTFCQTNSIFSEDVDYGYDEAGEPIEIPNESLKYWPAPSKRPKPDWLDELYSVDEKYEKLITALNELYGALDADLPILSGIAVRMCFDIVAEALGISADLTFDQKISELVKAGRLGATAEQRIKTAVEAGHAATHRGWVPAPEDLTTLVDVLEAFIYDSIVEPGRKAEMDHRAGELLKRVPPKQKKKKKPHTVQKTPIAGSPAS